MEIGSAIVGRSETLPGSLGYAVAGMAAAMVIAVLPLAFKLREDGLQVKTFRHQTTRWG